MIWPWSKAKATRAVRTAVEEFSVHAASHPEPYDAGQRLQSILGRARWWYVRQGLTPPDDLERLVKEQIQ